MEMRIELEGLGEAGRLGTAASADRE